MAGMPAEPEKLIDAITDRGATSLRRAAREAGCTASGPSS